MSTWSSCGRLDVILGYLIYPMWNVQTYNLSLSLSLSLVHAYGLFQFTASVFGISLKNSPLIVCMVLWSVLLWTRAAHTGSSPDTNQTLMKTSETLPGPLASTHNVPNHMLLLTPKCTLLIGAIVEILITPAGSPRMSRCEVPLYKHGVCWVFWLNCYSALISHFCPRAGYIFLPVNMKKHFTNSKAV